MQNARLAAKLTSWRIDIKSESRAAEVDLMEFASFDGSIIEPEAEVEVVPELVKVPAPFDEE